MSDDSIQKPISEGGSSQTPHQEKAKDERTDSQHNDMTAPSGDESGKPKPVKIVLIFAAFETGGYVFSEIADGVGGYMAVFIHWLSLCCAAAGFFAAWHEIAEGKKVFNIWMLYGIVSIALSIIAYLVWHPIKPEPIPIDTHEYTLLSTNTVNQVSELLKEPHNHNVKISLHLIDPDEVTYDLSVQIENLLGQSGYWVEVDTPLPPNLPVVPGMSCFWYGGGFSDNFQLLQALGSILTADGAKNNMVVLMAPDPQFTNSEAVLVMRRK